MGNMFVNFRRSSVFGAGGFQPTKSIYANAEHYAPSEVLMCYRNHLLAARSVIRDFFISPAYYNNHLEFEYCL